MADEFKALVVEQMLDIVPGAGEEIVQADDLRALRQEPFTKVRAQKTRPAGHQYTLLEMHQPR